MMEERRGQKGVGDALAEIAKVAGKAEITARDRQAVIDQVKRIQGLMG